MMRRSSMKPAKYFSIIFILLCILNSCNSKYDQKILVQQYEKSISIIMNPTDMKIKLSSNTKDYISANKNEYNKLLHIGKPLVFYILEKFQKTNSDGLEEAIMAQLCIDLLNDKDAKIEWQSGREWFEKYCASNM
jgi:hypothetical protein